MPRAKNSSPEALLVRARRTRVAELYLRSRSQMEIAEELGVNQSTISRDLRAIQDEWRERREHDLDIAKARELNRIDGIERSAWEGWERSCQERKSVSTEVEQPGGKKKGAQRITTKREGQAGDARFLERAAWCVEQRCRILGLLAPKQINLTPDAATERLAKALGLPAEALRDAT